MGCGASSPEPTSIVPPETSQPQTEQKREEMDGDDEFDFAAAPKKKIVKAAPEGEEGGKSYRPPPDNMFGIEALKYSRGNKPYVGSIRAPTGAPERPDAAAPGQSLSLEWIYGLTPSTRNIAVFNAKGEVVYPAASVAIVYDPKSHTQRFVRTHTDDISCIAVNPTDRNVIATGQKSFVEDEKSAPPSISVWDAKDGEQIARFQLKLTDRLIRCVSFSADGKYLAAVLGDDKNSIVVYDWDANKKVAELTGDGSDVYSIRWNTVQQNEFVLVGKNVIKLLKLEGSNIDSKKVALASAGISLQPFYSVAFTAKGSALVGAQDGSILVIKDGAVSSTVKLGQGRVLTIEAGEERIYVGTSEKKLVVLDKTLKQVKTVQFPSKVTTVTSLNGQLLVGADNSSLYLFENEAALDGQLPQPIVSAHCDGELWALATGKGDTLYTAGEDNTIRKWDLKAHKQLASATLDDKKAAAPKVAKASTTSAHPPNQQARAISLSPDGQQLAVGLNNGELSVFSSGDLSRLAHVNLNPHGKRQVTDQTGNWIQAMSYSPDGRFLAVGTHGSVIVILDAKSADYSLVSVIKSHNSFISSLDWTKDSKFIQSNCGAYELLFHDVQNAKAPQQLTDPDLLKDFDWASDTCCFAYATQGIFPVGADASDVNTAASNPAKTLLASGDDLGRVRLFRYPVANLRAESKDGLGHSSHVTRVQFTPDGEHLISAGGGDLCVFQWKVV